MKYFHKAVNVYMAVYKEEGSKEELEKLADKVLSEVEQSLSLSPCDEKKLSNLHIKKPHGAVKDCGTESQHFNKGMNISSALTPGKWPLHDILILQENWEKFCKKYDVENPFWFLQMKKHKKLNINANNLNRFKQFLSQRLHNRSFQSVYNKWVSLFCTPKSGIFSDAELSLTHQLMCRCKEEDISYVLTLALQRNRRFIMNKLKELHRCPKKDKVQWTKALENELVTSLVQELEAKELNELDQSIFTWQWTAVAMKMGMTIKEVYNRWYYHLHPALMVPEWLTRGQVQIRVIERLKQLLESEEVDDWRKVDWASLGHEVGGFASLYLYRLIGTLRWNYVRSKEDRDNIHETMKVLCEEALPNIRKRESKDKRRYLRRLVYNWTTHTLSEMSFLDEETGDITDEKEETEGIT